MNIKNKSYLLPQEATITNDILRAYIRMFWSEVYLPLITQNSNIHLLLMIKVEFTDSSMGNRSLANLRKVNYSDSKLFIEYLTGRLGILADTYRVKPFNKITFSYIVKDGIAEDTRSLLQEPVYEVTTHAYNNMQLPLTMDPHKYGTIISESSIDGKAEANIYRYVVENTGKIFVIDVSNDGNINNVQIKGAIALSWIDTKISGTTFKRELNKNILYIKDGVVAVKSKELNAKPFTHIKIDKKLDAVKTFMTIDIETVNIDGTLFPYLICGYTDNKYIHSYASEVSLVAVNDMFKCFIKQILEFKHIKYIYAHNLSGFDGILLLKHLIKYSGVKIKPLIFNGKLISIKMTVGEGKNARTIVFKDSYLLLPNTLRKLCDAFGVKVAKLSHCQT